MTIQNLSTKSLIPFALVLVGLLACTAPAAAGERYLKLVTGFGDLDDGGTLEVRDDRFASSAEASYDFGFRSGLAYGWRFSERFAIEGEYLYSTNDFDEVVFVDGERYDEGNYASVVISANVYTFFRPGQNVRPYVGVGLGWVQEVDIDFERDGGEISFETDELGLQLMAGVAWDVNERWTLDLQARWLGVSGVEMEAEEGGGRVTADYQPLSVFAGIGYRF